MNWYTLIIAGLMLAALGWYLYRKSESSKPELQPPVVSADTIKSPAPNPSGITEEELVAIAAAIRAYEGEGFVIKGIEACEETELAAITAAISAYEESNNGATEGLIAGRRKGNKSNWINTARREYQGRY